MRQCEMVMLCSHEKKSSDRLLVKLRPGENTLGVAGNGTAAAAAAMAAVAPTMRKKGIIPFFFSLHQTLTIFLSRYIMLMLIVCHILNLTSGYFALLLHLFFLPLARCLDPHLFHSLAHSAALQINFRCVRACVREYVCVSGVLSDCKSIGASSQHTVKHSAGMGREW